MRYKNLITEVLSAHADQLLKKQNRERDYTQLFPDNQDLPVLLTLADQVQATLKPVDASSSFKKQLYQDLLAAAHLKQFEKEQSVSHKKTVPNSFLISVIFSALIAVSSIVLYVRYQQRLRYKTLSNNVAN